eukprot:CAMPEP_0172447268 /NCGR_PEP_ID=MMETSP1065-20121228/6602_1 /TAXON_ID=265537 /ORGANISM="Amphiprora paludosa, Strain CCMP125" /LENGTH=249 /DNA_ID=CAMNT_0013198515 /DNA_START=34 /DNA_END=783 /DNA_ORIENTATION=+
MALNRPSSPTTVANHPAGCTCGCTHTFPKALYRKFRDDDDEVFTGFMIVDSDWTTWRLNNPNMDITVGDLSEQQGHVVDNEEFILTLKLYYANPEERVVEGQKIKEITHILKDFPDKPQDFDLKMDLDVAFPHGTPGSPLQGRWTIPQIRAGDRVRIMAVKQLPAFEFHGMEFPAKEATERCWVSVVGVACTPGYLVGIMEHNLDSPMLQAKQFPSDMTMDEDYHIHEDDLVSFPVTCVYGVLHGRYWE